MAVQSMRFRHNNRSIDFSEKINPDFVRVSFFNENPGSYGELDLTELNLRELRSWISKQLRSISKKKK